MHVPYSEVCVFLFVHICTCMYVQYVHVDHQVGSRTRAPLATRSQKHSASYVWYYSQLLSICLNCCQFVSITVKYCPLSITDGGTTSSTFTSLYTLHSHSLCKRCLQMNNGWREEQKQGWCADDPVLECIMVQSGGAKQPTHMLAPINKHGGQCIQRWPKTTNAIKSINILKLTRTCGC